MQGLRPLLKIHGHVQLHVHLEFENCVNLS